jgi:hypothetical protein
MYHLAQEEELAELLRVVRLEDQDLQQGLEEA